jgi:hypothetical protein
VTHPGFATTGQNATDPSPAGGAGDIGEGNGHLGALGNEKVEGSPVTTVFVLLSGVLKNAPVVVVVFTSLDFQAAGELYWDALIQQCFKDREDVSD